MHDDKMPAEHYRSLRELENAYWWHQTRYRLVRTLLERAGGGLEHRQHRVAGGIDDGDAPLAT